MHVRQPVTSLWLSGGAPLQGLSACAPSVPYSKAGPAILSHGTTIHSHELNEAISREPALNGCFNKRLSTRITQFCPKHGD